MPQKDLVSPFQTICHRSQNEQHPQFLEECRDELGMPSKLPLLPCSALHQQQTVEAFVCRCLIFKAALILADIQYTK
jgi:hypothetical protein